MCDTKSWALIYVEEKSPSWDSGGGKWYNENRWKYLWNSFDHETICDMEPEVKEAMQKYDFFYVLLCGVSWYYELPYNSVDGFDPGCAGVEYDDLFILPVLENGQITIVLPESVREALVNV